MLTTIAAVIYGFLGVLGYPSRGIEWVHLQPLQYVLLLLTLLCMGASGLAYFLDLFRVPPTVLVIGALVLSYGVLDTDHDYPVLERQPAAPLSTPLNAAGAFRAWCESHPPATHPVPIFVTASGGGITAALWTARVLQGLQEAAGPHDRRVAESIVLLSTVSGGSVGAMHFLDGFEAGVAPDLARAREAVEAAGRNSLAAAVWGLLYPDLLRSTFVPFLSNTFDRGWALEERWRLALAHPDATLGGLAAEVARGRLPVFVFNATLVESGERLLLSPLSAMKRGGPSAVHEFLQLYPSADLSLVTAARLSASFPYVSPLARPARVAEGEERFHVGDGGYFDNDGVVTALEFLEETPEILAEHGRTRAVLLQIRAFPSEFDPLPGNGPPGGHGSRPCAHVAG
ncbi:MAG TPA: hypothetical protein VFX28_03640, partial [Methylomirabilota bacterium]|nr:hypothetical protein [Methylomirabilota bacterium]